MIETDGRQYVIKLSNGTFTNAFNLVMAKALDNFTVEEANTYSAVLNIAHGLDERAMIYKVIPAILNKEIKLISTPKNVYTTDYGMLKIPARLKHLL